MSEGWRSIYEEMGVDADSWEEDPLAKLRDREEVLEAIAESDAPDAPVARIMLSLIRGESVTADDLAAIRPEEKKVHA